MADNESKTTAAGKGCCGNNNTSKVKPDAKTTTSWTFDDIVKDIMLKNDKRKLCDACVATGDTTLPFISSPMCHYFRQEDSLIKAGNHAIVSPKDTYKNNKDQGARLACYQLWTMLEHGTLGRSRRKPLPACVEAHIKMKYPSQTFTGYRPIERKRNTDVLSSDDDTWEGTHSPRQVQKKPKKN